MLEADSIFKKYNKIMKIIHEEKMLTHESYTIKEMQKEIEDFAENMSQNNQQCEHKWHYVDGHNEQWVCSKCYKRKDIGGEFN